jgi:DNA-binding HxlR family transcriptional regulator
VSSKDKAAARRSPCPVAATLDLIGDKWTLLIIRDLFAGKSRYRELVKSPEGIATNILAARLQLLQACGLVVARASSQRVGSWEYRLTARGRSLLPVLQAMRDWGLIHVPGTVAEIRVGTGVRDEPG